MQTRDDVAAKFLKGRGVELGPGLAPTRVGPEASLCFVDKRSPEELKVYFGSPEVVAGEQLEAYDTGSFDFLIAHHVLEHCSNVIEELIRWMSFLKDEATLFISVPDKNHCPDNSRLVTPPSHFIYDYLAAVDDSSFESREHIYSFLWGWSDAGGLEGKTKQDAAALVSAAAHKPKNDLHWHVFTAATLKFVVETAALLSGRTARVALSDNGFPHPEHRVVVTLAKAATMTPSARRLLELRQEVAPAVLGFCLEHLEGQPLYALSEPDAGKIFVAENSKAHWVRDPQELADRGITDTPPVYIEFGRARAIVVGGDIVSSAIALTGRRREAVQERVRLFSGEGLEMSPGAAPLIAKSEGKVRYCDKVGSDFWRKRYGSTQNVEVDVIMGDRTLDEVFAAASFDYVVSSHVLEHIPDFIGFFISAERVLRPMGDLVMLVPDKRYTFDILREPSTVEQIELAHEARLTHPSREMVFDFYSHIDQSASAEALWKGTHEPRPTHANARALMETIKPEDVDVHCWVFTPTRMRELLAHVCDYHAQSLELMDVSGTPIGGNEFLVHLRKR